MAGAEKRLRPGWVKLSVKEERIESEAEADELGRVGPDKTGPGGPQEGGWGVVM